MWPETVAYTNAETYGKFDCRILHLATKDECEKLAKSYSKTKLEQAASVGGNASSDVFSRIESLEDKISNIERLLARVELKLTVLEDVVVPKPTVRKVGTSNLVVPVHYLTEAMSYGVTSGAFMNVAKRQFGSSKFEGKSWTKLDKNFQTEIQELLAYFVLFNLTQEKGAKPKPSECHATYIEIYKSFTTKLINELYLNKATASAHITTSKEKIQRNVSSKYRPSKGESVKRKKKSDENVSVIFSGVDDSGVFSDQEEAIVRLIDQDD